MKSFKDLNFDFCYDSGSDDIIENFFIPVLESAVHYDRIAGFYSSSSLAIAAKGIAGLITNGGKMRLLASPRLSKVDAEILKGVILNPEEFKGEGLSLNIESIEDEFTKNHVKALGWLVANNFLEIKLVIVIKNNQVCSEKEIEEMGIFHQKVGILNDKDNISLSFSGSINESASAWIYNIEEFKVFPSWLDGANYYYKKDREKFDDFWFGKRDDVKVLTLPDAIKQELIEISKGFDINSIAKEEYFKRKSAYQKNELVTDIGLFDYQKEAVNKWLLNNKCLLFEMATGTGKTRTAIGSILKILNKDPIITVIATPQGTLSLQWKDDIDNLKIKFDDIIIADGTNPKWRVQLRGSLLKIQLGHFNNLVIYTTHDTCSNSDFISHISQCNNEVKLLLVADECHGLGAKKARNGLLERYNYRIGLSATPARWFDDEGSKMIKDYFGNNSFEFSIKDALTKFNPKTGKHFLVNYYYFIEKVSLDEKEALNYEDISKRILNYFFKKDKTDREKDRLKRLLENRADIIKNANGKYKSLEIILDKIQQLPGGIKDTIIFVSPAQMSKVQDILLKYGIIYHKLTENEGTKPMDKYNGLSERQFIIEQFKQGNYQSLIAIKCLDEGIDIPTASKGILMASSTNPREYVQRIGRIIRQSDNKENAYLFDLCVSSLGSLSSELKEMEKKIREKEIIRLKEIADNAINRTDATIIINTLN